MACNILAVAMGLLYQSQRVLVMIEDYQWLDPSSQTLCVSLATKVPQVSFLVATRPLKPDAQLYSGLVAARPDHTTQVELPALDGAASKSLVADLLQADSVDDRVLDLVLHSSQGIPLFTTVSRERKVTHLEREKRLIEG